MRGIPVQRLIEHPGIPTHEEVFIQISESCIGRALRTPEWTYCVEAPLNSSQKQELLLPDSPLYEEKYLYHLPTDEGQKNNLIKDVQYRKICDELRQKLTKYIWQIEGKTPEIRDQGC